MILMVQVLVVDDNPLFRAKIARILDNEELIEIIGYASNGQEAVTLSKVLKPDVVLMDLDMPVMDGKSATSKIKNDNPEIKVIILSMFGKSDELNNCIRAGASDYILKEESSLIPEKILANHML